MQRAPLPLLILLLLAAGGCPGLGLSAPDCAGIYSGTSTVSQSVNGASPTYSTVYSSIQLDRDGMYLKGDGNRLEVGSVGNLDVGAVHLEITVTSLRQSEGTLLIAYSARGTAGDSTYVGEGFSTMKCVGDGTLDYDEQLLIGDLANTDTVRLITSGILSK